MQEWIEFARKLVEQHGEEFLEVWTPWIMIWTGVIVFVLEAFGGLRAAYGRYNKSNFGLGARAAWLLQESPAFYVPLAILVFYGRHTNVNLRDTNLVLLFCFMLHYFHRSFIYTLRIRSAKRVNFLENGLAFVFCVVNGMQIGHFHAKYAESEWSEWRFWFGIGLFFLGLAINIDSDNRLIRLRESNSNEAKSEYKIPRGGLFEYVSAANYFGECMEWLGFAIASWSLPATAFSLFTWANIGPRAYHHHLFYKEKFGSRYPKKRKAIIPFVI